MILGYIDYLSRELNGLGDTARPSRWTLILLLLGGYGVLAMFYYGGATSVPRRFATYPPETIQGVMQAQAAAAFAVVLIAGMAIYLWQTGGRCLRALALSRRP